MSKSYKNVCVGKKVEVTITLAVTRSRTASRDSNTDANDSILGFFGPCNKVPEAITRMHKFSMSVQGKYCFWYSVFKPHHTLS